MKKVVLVTGASSGIGLETVKLLRDRFIVFATAKTSSLSRFNLAGIYESQDLLIRALNVCNSSERVQLFEEINQKFGKLDVLVNNAGISFRSSIEEMSEEEEKLQFETNFLAPLALMKLAIPKMRESRNGKIINVSSVSGMMAMPSMGSYSASKWALEGVSEALWYELRPWGISISLIEPGFIRSHGFENVKRSKRSLDPSSPYSKMYHHMGCFVEKLMNKAFVNSSDIARKILKTIEDPSPPLRVIPSIDATFFAFLRRMLPRPIYHRILYHSLPGIKEWEDYAKSGH